MKTVIFAASLLVSTITQSAPYLEYDANVIKCRSYATGEIIRLPRDRYPTCPSGFYEWY